MSSRITLESPWGYRERVLLTANAGSGKTHSVLSILRRINKGKMWILDNDFSFAYRRALETPPPMGFADVDASRYELMEISDDWLDLKDTLATVLTKGDHEDDWLVIDSCSPTWDAVQTWYSKELRGESLATHMREMRKQAADAKEYAQLVSASANWNDINAEYFDGFYGAIRKWKGHLILTAEAKATSKNDEEAVLDMFGHLGIKPAGQKRLAFLAHTNLVLAKKGHGAFVAYTAKDRNREEMERMPVADFAMDYLKTIAGWKIKMVKETGDGDE